MEVFFLGRDIDGEVEVYEGAGVRNLVEMKQQWRCHLPHINILVVSLVMYRDNLQSNFSNVSIQLCVKAPFRIHPS